ncbi:MAG TPA: hypothetical protein VHD87_12995 [Acidimicrobiales bacterium]|nr:hypothetical protein [Acidimicrobiales bacterium]
MTTKKQRRARAGQQRQRAAARKAERAKVMADAQALMTDDQLLAWARDRGVELTEREQLLDSVAVSFAVQGWRNTVLENIHAGDELNERIADENERETEAAAFSNELRELLTDCRGVADDAEEERLEVFLAGRGDGHGIPDDIMLRMNVATALELRHALDQTLPDTVTTPGADLAVDDLGLPGYVRSVADVLADPDRELVVGCAVFTAGEVIGEEMWDDYLEDLWRKLGAVGSFVELLGARRALWLAALTATSYASDWFPAPAWARGVAALRHVVTRGSAEEARWGTGPGWDPTADDDDFWAALTTAPNTLNGMQARWVIASYLDDYLRAAREDDRQRLGALPDEQRLGLPPLF